MSSESNFISEFAELSITKLIENYLEKQEENLQLAIYISNDSHSSMNYRKENSFVNLQGMFPNAKRLVFDKVWEYFSNIEQHQESIKNLSPKEQSREIKKYFSKYSSAFREVHTQYGDKYFSFVAESSKNDINNRKFLSSMLIMIVSEFDNFLSELSYLYLKHFPSRMYAKTIKFEDTANFSSIDEISNFLIRKEVNELSYKEFPTRIRNTFSIGNNKPIPLSLNNFVLLESFQRRNIIVHANGKISPIYLKKLEQYPTEISSLQVGDMLDVDIDYLKLIYDAVIIASLTLIKMYANNTFNQNEIILDNVIFYLYKSSFQSLLLQRYEIASQISHIVRDFDSLNHKKDFVDFIYVNGWIAGKELGLEEKVKEEVLNWDIENSNLHDFLIKQRFILAKYVLLDDDINTHKQINYLASEEMLSFSEFVSCPLLKKYVGSKKFNFKF